MTVRDDRVSGVVGYRTNWSCFITALLFRGLDALTTEDKIVTALEQVTSLTLQRIHIAKVNIKSKYCTYWKELLHLADNLYVKDIKRKLSTFTKKKGG